MILTSSDYLQIIVAAIYTVALYYTVVTFRRSKELDQITVTETIFKDLRELDRELYKLPSDSQQNEVRNDLYTRILNTMDWLSYLINVKVVSDKRMIAYMKPTFLQYYQDSNIQNILANERYSNSYQEFRKLYKKMNA